MNGALLFLSQLLLLATTGLTLLFIGDTLYRFAVLGWRALRRRRGGS